jgi:hypothetical protein
MTERHTMIGAAAIGLVVWDAAANDQQPVQAIDADGTDPPLGVGVGVRRLDGVTSTSAPSRAPSFGMPG